MVGGIWSNKVGDPSSTQLAIELAFALEGKGGELEIRAIGLGGRWEWGLLVKAKGRGMLLDMTRNREMCRGVGWVEGREEGEGWSQESELRQDGTGGARRSSPRRR